MFIVTLLLNEVIAWMRGQSGTSSLRAILYMDEIFGYFPPTANPPSKQPMLTLLKQGRAFGLGCVLATQNPVDLDYKGLANAGTWMIGRLQTERDKLRVLEGLESAVPGSDRAALDKMISGLTPRVFLMRNVHDDAPVLFQSRWALSYLRGPLTGVEISKLMAPRRSTTPARFDPARARPANEASSRPSVPADVPEYFLAATAAGDALLYKPMMMGSVKLHFVDAKLALDQWQTTAYLAPLADDGGEVLWDEAKNIPDLKSRLGKAPAPSSTFAQLPAGALRAQSYAAWGKALSAYLFESARSEVLVCDALKATSPPGMSEGDFRAQLALAAREQRDAAVADLKRKYAPKLATIEDQLRRGAERIERERSQLSQQKMQSAFSIGASVLGALLGRRTLSATNVNRAASAARSATRIGRESGDVDRASESLEAIQQRQRDLQQQFDADAAALEGALRRDRRHAAQGAGQPAQVGYRGRRSRVWCGRRGAKAQTAFRRRRLSRFSARRTSCGCGAPATDSRPHRQVRRPARRSATTARSGRRRSWAQLLRAAAGLAMLLRALRHPQPPAQTQQRLSILSPAPAVPRFPS